MRRLTVLTALVLAVFLAGCGVTGVGGQPSASGSPTTGPTTGTGVRPCPGPSGSVNDIGSVAVVLTSSDTASSGAAAVGDIIQVRLPTTQHWGLSKTPSGLTVIDPAGIQDDSLKVCAWNFRAVAAGDYSLEFVGTAVCENPHSPCPQYARVAEFSVHIS